MVHETIKNILILVTTKYRVATKRLKTYRTKNIQRVYRVAAYIIHIGWQKLRNKHKEKKYFSIYRTFVMLSRKSKSKIRKILKVLSFECLRCSLKRF